MGVSVFMHTQLLLEVQGRRLRVENLAGTARRAFDVLGLIEARERETEPA
jgi:hypothetical protein